MIVQPACTEETYFEPTKSPARYLSQVLFLLCCDVFCNYATVNAQQTFEYEEGDTTYVMQEYYVVYLNAGDQPKLDSTEAARIQTAHLAHLERMAQEGYLSIVGPFGDEGSPRGMCIYNTATAQEADSLAHIDPAVKAGRLRVEVRPWWAAKGSVLR